MIICEKKIELKMILQYILIVLIMYLSGNVFFKDFNYSYSVVIVFLFSILVNLYIVKKNRYRINILAIAILMIYAILMILTIILNNEFKVSSYIAILIQLLIAILTCRVIPINRFKRYYIKIITFFAISSLIFHIIGLLYPNFVTIFPKTEALASTNYYNAIIHVYQTLVGYDKLVFFPRNAGIFWEPGVYQAYLNIGLIFLLDIITKNEHAIKNRRLIFISLIITIITTYSTTGYLILIILLIIYRKQIIKLLELKNLLIKFRNIKNIKILIAIYSLAGLIIIFVGKEIFSAIGLISTKYLVDVSNVFERISFDKLSLLFSDIKTFFFGISFTKYFTSTSSIWNSIIQTALVFGAPFTIILLSQYFVASKYVVQHRFLLFSVLIIVFSTESLFWRPFFLYFAFVIIERVHFKRKKEKMSETESKVDLPILVE